MRIKPPLPEVAQEDVAAEVEHFTRELAKHYPILGKLPPQLAREPHRALAYVALYPGILTEPEMCAPEQRAFAHCFKRYPDLVIEALAFVRRQANERENAQRKQSEKDSQTQAGRVRKFLKENSFVFLKNKRYLPVSAVTPADYKADHKTLRDGLKFEKTGTVIDKDLASCISRCGFEVTAESVKQARRSLAKVKI